MGCAFIAVANVADNKPIVSNLFIILDILGESFEGVALVTEPLDGGGEGSTELVDGLQGIVEGDDGAITRVPLYIIDDIFGCRPL